MLSCLDSREPAWHVKRHWSPPPRRHSPRRVDRVRRLRRLCRAAPALLLRAKLNGRWCSDHLQGKFCPYCRRLCHLGARCPIDLSARRVVFVGLASNPVRASLCALRHLQCMQCSGRRRLFASDMCVSRKVEFTFSLLSPACGSVRTSSANQNPKFLNSEFAQIHIQNLDKGVEF